MALQAMNPPLTIISGLSPKNAGFQRTRPTSFPGSIEPISAANPCVMAGLIMHFATQRLARKLSLRLQSSVSGLRFAFSAIEGIISGGESLIP